MLGYDITWAAFNIIEVMSSSKFTYKVEPIGHTQCAIRHIYHIHISLSHSHSQIVILVVTHMYIKMVYPTTVGQD